MVKAAASGKIGLSPPLDRPQHVQSADRSAQVRTAHTGLSAHSLDAAVAARKAAIRRTLKLIDVSNSHSAELADIALTEQNRDLKLRKCSTSKLQSLQAP